MSLIAFTNDNLIASFEVLSDNATALHQTGILPNEWSPNVEKEWPAPITAVAKNDASEGANVALINSYFAAELAGTTVAEFVALPLKGRLAAMRESWTIETPEALAKAEKGAHERYDIVKLDVIDLWAAGDWVVAKAQVDYKWTAGFPVAKGKTEKSTVGKTSGGTEVHFFRFADGKIAETIMFHNNLHHLNQVGLFDPATLPKPESKK